MRFLKKNLKWVTVGVMVVLIIGGLFLKYSLLMKKDQVYLVDDFVLEEEVDDLELENDEEVIESVYVDIKGAVNQPGVYEIEASKKVIDVVQLAGGFAEQADTSLVNLAKKVSNEMVIIIYTSEEVKKATEGDAIAKIVDNQCVCPQIKNDACINTDTSSNFSSSSSGEDSSTQKVNLNTATLEELQTLSGIGESKAKAIIEYRETNGFFQSIEELMEVSGIGESLYEKVKNNITV